MRQNCSPWQVRSTASESRSRLFFPLTLVSLSLLGELGEVDGVLSRFRHCEVGYEKSSKNESCWDRDRGKERRKKEMSQLLSTVSLQSDAFDIQNCWRKKIMEIWWCLKNVLSKALLWCVSGNEISMNAHTTANGVAMAVVRC